MIARRTDVASTQFGQCGLPGKPAILLILASLFACVGCKQSSNEMQLEESPMSIELTSTAFQQGTSHSETVHGRWCGSVATLALVRAAFRDQEHRPDLSMTLTLPVEPGSIGFSSTCRPKPVNWRRACRQQQRSHPGRSKARTTSATSVTAVQPRPRARRTVTSSSCMPSATAVDLAPGATKAELENAMKGHILAEGQLMGTYQR